VEVVRDVVRIEPVVGGGYMILCNGFQWGNDRSKFDHGIGCSGQEFATIEEARDAVAIATAKGEFGCS
jgi:hypothetical protein